MKKTLYLISILFLLLGVACSKDDPVDPGKDKPPVEDPPVETKPLSFTMASIDDPLLIEFDSIEVIDFLGSGIEEINLVAPKGWKAEHSYDEEGKKGTITITAPSEDADYDDDGKVVIKVKGEKDQLKEENISVKLDVSAFSLLKFNDIPSDITLTKAVLMLLNEEDTLIMEANKAEDLFRTKLPKEVESMHLYSAEISVTGGSFTYYFPPETQLLIDELNELSLAPPTLYSYWAGGMVIKVNESNATGLDAYNITGTALALDQDKQPWHHNEDFIPGAVDEDDGRINTQAILEVQNTAMPPYRSVNTAARWVEFNHFGGFSDWYLPAINELVYLAELYIVDKEIIKDALAEYGADEKVLGSAEEYWSSTDHRVRHTYSTLFSTANINPTGIKVYGAQVLAFRRF